MPKTEEFLDPLEAYNHIQNGKLAYIDAIEDIDDEWAVELIYKIWDEEVLPVAKPDTTEVRFVLGRLAKRKDPYAVPGLLSRIDLLQVDPQRAIGYLAETVAEDQDVAEQLAGHLAMPPTVTTEALHLHVCRFLASANRSSVVATASERVLDAAPSFGAIRGRWRLWRVDDAHAGATATLSTEPMRSPTLGCGGAWWAQPEEWPTMSVPGGWRCPTWLGAILRYALPSSGPWLRRRICKPASDASGRTAVRAAFGRGDARETAGGVVWIPDGEGLPRRPEETRRTRGRGIPCELCTMHGSYMQSRTDVCTVE